MDPGRRKRGIDKGVTGCHTGGLGAWEIGSDVEENSQSLVNERRGNLKDLKPRVWVESPSEGRGGVEDLTWFPLVPGGPSFPG